MKKLKLRDNVNSLILDDDQYEKAKQYRWRLGSNNTVIRNVINGQVTTSQSFGSFLFGEVRYSLNKNPLDFRLSNRVRKLTRGKPGYKIDSIIRTRQKRDKKKIPVGIQNSYGNFVVKIQREGQIIKFGRFAKLKDAKAYLAAS